MRASRLLSIQMVLETRGRTSATALARMLEVSVRTLHRDVDQLTAAGVPIIAERGRNGGFRLMEGWTTTLTGLTPAESQAVFLSGLGGPAKDLGLDDHVRGARLKLLAALPKDWRSDATRISSRIHLDPVDWYRPVSPTPHLATVAQAVWTARQLALEYESWNGVVRRTVTALGLVLKAGTWYLVAQAEARLRTYRVSNIRMATLLAAVGKRPRAFDLAQYWQGSVRRFETEILRYRATVLVDAKGLKHLRNLNTAVVDALAGISIADPGGARVAAMIPIESIDHAVSQLLPLAPHVEVLEPAGLRAAIIAQLRAALATYAVRRVAGRAGLNLDEKGKTTREPVNDPLLSSVRHKIRDAGEALRTNKLPRHATWDEHACGSCDLVGLCRKRP